MNEGLVSSARAKRSTMHRYHISSSHEATNQRRTTFGRLNTEQLQRARGTLQRQLTDTTKTYGARTDSRIHATRAHRARWVATHLSMHAMQCSSRRPVASCSVKTDSEPCRAYGQASSECTAAKICVHLIIAPHLPSALARHIGSIAQRCSGARTTCRRARAEETERETRSARGAGARNKAVSAATAH